MGRRLASADTIPCSVLARGSKTGEPPRVRASTQGDAMLWTIFVILLVLWLLGMVSSYTMGGFIHVLLVVAIVVALIQLIQGRRVV
jgi:hypothetical protein